jgi:uncharacterized phage protein (TIGR02220 family)
MDLSDYQANYTIGWVKLFRSLANKGWYKNSEYVHLWIHILISANHTGKEFFFNDKIIKLEPGQFVTGRKKLSKEIGVNESKVERVLNFFEKNEQQIEQQKSNKNRIITVLKWESYQKSEQENEQQLNNKRTTTEQQLNTTKKERKKESKKSKEKRESGIPNYKDVLNYCNEIESNVDAKYFFDNCESKKWRIGKSKIKDWKSLLRSWEDLDEGSEVVVNEKSGKSVVEEKYFKMFKEITGKKVRVLNDKVKRQLHARLKEGYTLEDFKIAITNCYNNEFHIKNKHANLTLEFLTRSDKLELHFAGGKLIEAEKTKKSYNDLMNEVMGKREEKEYE